MDSNDIKLVDFGLARNLDAAEETKSSFGTPDFVGKNERFSDQFNYNLGLVIQALVLLLQIGKGKKTLEARLLANSSAFFISARYPKLTLRLSSKTSNDSKSKKTLSFIS